jgi:hypothetical protein
MMGKLVVGKETFAWGDDFKSMPEDAKSEGPRVLNLAAADEVIGAINESDLAMVPDLSEVYCVDEARGTRRRVVVNTPGKSGVPLLVWARPEGMEGVEVPVPAGGPAPATAADLHDEMPPAGGAPPPELGFGDAQSPPPNPNRALGDD